jgi:hypothetical protein
MKVGELIRLLQQDDPNLPVLVRIGDGPDMGAKKEIKTVAYGMNPDRVVLNVYHD